MTIGFTGVKNQWQANTKTSAQRAYFEAEAELSCHFRRGQRKSSAGCNDLDAAVRQKAYRGPVGIGVVIVQRELLARSGQPRAEIFDYRAQLKAESMLNTPPTWNWYMLGLTVRWMLDEGGVDEFARRSARKSGALYAAIDGSGGFYRNEVSPAVRSRMNVPFFLHDEALEKPFLAEAQAAGLIGLKGHRALGGMRASIYNAMPEAGVQALVAFMRDFQTRHG